MDAILKAIGFAVIILVLLPLMSLLGAIPIYFLWNWLMPMLFHLMTITFQQALGNLIPQRMSVQIILLVFEVIVIK